MSLLDTPVREAAWAALDFESAGAAPGRSDEPVQVGIAVWRGGEMTDFFRSYVQSPVRITRSAHAVHGIGDDHIRDAPPMTALWPEFKSRLAGAVVVAHGAGTEKRFLRAFPLHGFGPWLDTLVLSRAVLPDLPTHALGDVASALGVVLRFVGNILGGLFNAPGLQFLDAMDPARHITAAPSAYRAAQGIKVGGCLRWVVWCDVWL